MNDSRILTIKNAKLSGYYFYMNLNVWADCQICISVPLNKKVHINIYLLKKDEKNFQNAP